MRTTKPNTKGEMMNFPPKMNETQRQALQLIASLGRTPIAVLQRAGGIRITTIEALSKQGRIKITPGTGNGKCAEKA